MLPISPEREAKTVNAQMQEMKDLLREGSENGRTKTRAEKRTTRQIENKIQKYKEKLKELSQGRKDDTIYLTIWEWIALFVDEAHAYKALAIVTKMGNIAGISTASHSGHNAFWPRSSSCRRRTMAQALIFTTATPITKHTWRTVCDDAIPGPRHPQ